MVALPAVQAAVTVAVPLLNLALQKMNDGNSNIQTKARVNSDKKYHGMGDALSADAKNGQMTEGEITAAIGNLNSIANGLAPLGPGTSTDQRVKVLESAGHSTESVAELLETTVGSVRKLATTLIVRLQTGNRQPQVATELGKIVAQLQRIEDEVKSGGATVKRAADEEVVDAH